MHSIIFFFQCFLTCFLCYASTVSVYLSFFKSRNFDFLTLFFVLTLVSLCLFSFWQIYQTIKNSPLEKQLLKNTANTHYFIERLKNKRFLIVLIFCLISLLVGFFNVYTQCFRGLQISETVQLMVSRHLPANIMETSYRQQQPPLDYYFSSFSSKLWGDSKFSVRFHAMAFYLILSLILPLMLWFFCSSFWLVGLGILLFSINHAIRLHSVNGRPLSLALLTGFLFFFFYMAYCNKSRSEKESLFFPVLSSQYLFVMSIGFQPVVFIVALFISSFWLLLKNKKVIFKKLFLSHALTALLTLPVYIKMYSFGQDAYKFKNFSLEKISSYMENYNILDLFKRYFFPFYEQLLPSFLLLVVGLVAVVFIRKKISDLTVQIGSALIVFPLLFDFLFNMAINYRMNYWYFIVWSLFVIFFCILGLNEVLQLLKNKHWKTYLLLSVGMLFLWNSYSQITTIRRESQFRYPYINNDVERAWDYLKEKGNPEDMLVELSLVQPPDLRTMGNLGSTSFIFYEPKIHPILTHYYIEITKTPPFFYELKEDQISYINWEEVPKKENQKIFFVVVNDREENKAYSVLSGFMEEYRIGGFSIFEWSVKTENREREYKRFLVHLIERTPPKYRAALYETLLYYACKNRNESQFSQLLKEYRALEPFLDEFITDVKLPSRFALRRRARYFENGDYCYSETED